MKKAIKLLCGIMCLFMVMTVLLTGCDFGNVDVAHGKDQTPVYYGMLLFDSSDVKIPEVNYVDETSNSSDNQYGWYKDNDGLVRPIHDKQEPLYVSQNQDVYAYVGISNPSEFQIVSFVINGQTFTSDMFDARSTNEVKIVKLNVGNARGIVEYTVSDIKYADGKEIKNVYMLGDPVAKASVKAENQITATVNKIELKDSGKEIFFDITITDEYGLIASGKGNVKLLVYRDGKVQKEAELTGGENKITIKTLNKNKEHEYEIVAYYDDFSGQGTSDHTLVSKYPLQKDHSHTFGEWETAKAPTCGKDGEKARICSGCGTSETEKLSATGLHSFDNNCDATCNGCEFIRTVGDHVYDNACDWNCNVCGYPRAVGDHVYDDQYDDTCNECGFVRDADCKHVYDNDCDTICNACGEIRTVDPSVHVYDNACDWNCNVCGYPRAVGDHVYDDQYDATCNECGFVRDADCKHVYDNDCDTICNACGEIRTVDPSVHVYDNACDWNCNVCGYPRAVGDHVYDDQYDDTCNECGFVRDADCKHVYDNDCDTICNACGEIRTVDPSVHVYDNACDTTCNVCGDIRLASHNYEGEVTPSADYATILVIYTCSGCGDTYNETVTPTDFTVTAQNRAMVGYTGAENENLVIPAVFEDNGTWYRVTAIESCTFNGCSALKSIIIPDSVTNLGDKQFDRCSSLVSVTIGSGISRIEYYTFAGCSSLVSVVISNSVTRIDEQVFYYCDALAYIYYEGSKNEWNNVTIGYDNNDLLNATRYYYSETEPTTEGNYWHWVDGVPTVWEVEIHTHSYTSTVTPPTATENGVITYTCSCTDSYTEELIPQDFTVTQGNRAMIGYTGAENENLVIPAVFENNGTWYRVNAIGDWIFGDLAFENRSNLISVTIPDSVTTIGYGAFSDCNGISSITIPKSVVSIGRGAFADCDTLTEIVVDGYNTTYQSINGNVYTKDGTVLVAYAVGKSEISFEIPNSVIIIGEGAFSGCYNLTNVTIPNSVTTIGIEAFYRCFGLTSIVIPDSVTDIDTWAFYCSGLQSVTIGAGVKNVGTASFFACSSLKTIVFKDGAAVIGSWMFGDCSSLTDVVIPNSISLIYGDAFDRCSVLKNIYYKGTAEEWNAIVIDNTYPSSNNILDFTIYYYSETQPITEGNFWHYVDGVPTVWQIHTHSYTSAVTTEPTATANGVITYTCSCGDSYIEELVPQDFTVTADNRAMVGYTGAAGETLVIPSRIQIDGNWHRVTSIGDYAFSDCSNLVSVIIPNSVTSIGTGAFMLCSNLSNTKIPNSVRSVGSYAFYGCDKLMQKENGIFYVDKWAVDYDWYSGNSLSNYVSLRSDTIGIAISALSYYDALKGIVLPSGLKYIDDCAFTGCSNLTSINIPSSVIRVGGDAFLECDNIVTTQGGVEYVGNWAVWCDSDIREVTLRQGTVGLCDWLFTYCAYLFDITLPNSVKYIGENQFGENRWDGRVYLRFDGTIQEFVSILPTDWNPQGIDYSLEIVCSDAIVTLDFRYTVKTENGNWTWVEGMKINFTGTMEQWEKLFPTNWGLIPEKIICSDGVMKLN